MTEAVARAAAIDLLGLAGLHDLRSLALIGLSKNAGKTTVLNHIIAAWQETNQRRPLALTSIGRDGETEDIVSGRAKPRIYIPSGTLIASAEGALQRSDALLEILELTNVRTAFGEVILCRALSDGYVELAGPSAADEIEGISDLIRQHEPDSLFIIDGALSRRSQAGTRVIQQVIMAVSAATSAVPDILAEKTAYALDLLHSPLVRDDEETILLHTLRENPEARVIAVSKGKDQPQSKSIELPSLVGYGKEISKEIKKDTTMLYLGGAITDHVVNELLKEPGFTKLKLVVEDGTRLFIKPDTKWRLQQRKIELAVLNALEVRLVCLNPTRPNGQALDPEPFLDSLRQSINTIPVVDLGPANM